MSYPIEDYAIIGDLHSVALISKAGSIDWLCLPVFDSGACFASLLGNETHGHWTIAPTVDVNSVNRRYRPDTLVLETEVATETGTVRFTDFMPSRDDNPVIIRVIEGLEGTVEVRSTVNLRFDYGSARPYIEKAKNGHVAVSGPNGVLLVGPDGAALTDDGLVTDLAVKAGETYSFQLLWFTSWEPVPTPKNAENALETATSVWREWSEKCKHAGPYRDAVVRSLITLKALTYLPSGGITAAATTSLPETIGGDRNWDYRYCWLRDSSVTLEALNREGYIEEAKAFRGWLVRAAAGDPGQMQIMYGIGGERRLEEWTVDWLPGYMDSAPVRIGNGAAGQFQLDVYGELLDAAHYARLAGLAVVEEYWELSLLLGTFVEEHWQEPDDGIWEVRGGREHFVYSKVMAWVAADRLALAIETHGLSGDAKHWRALADAIHADICEKGVDSERNCFVQFYGSKAMDASLLMLPQVGFLPPDDPRIINTVHAIEEELVVNGLVLRYRTGETNDGLSGEEGSFVICTFWLVVCQAMIGEYDKARILFDRMLDLRNDVGLLAEEYDSINHRMLGNMPQAFSHVGLIMAAHALADYAPSR